MYIQNDNETFGENLGVTVTLDDGSIRKWSPLPGDSNDDYSGNLLGTIRVCVCMCACVRACVCVCVCVRA